MLMLLCLGINQMWAADVVVTLDNIGTDLGSTANTEMATTTITASGTENDYVLNYFQCKKQGNSILMTKSVSPFISNATAMPGNIKSVEVFINSAASGKTTYDVAFSTTACTTAVSGIGAVNIAGGNSHVFSNMDGDDIKVAGRYFCVTLGNANNGQVLKIVVTCESSDDPSVESSESSVDFGDVELGAGESGHVSQTIVLTGENLESNVILSCEGSIFSAYPTVITPDDWDANNQKTVTVYAQTGEAGEYASTLTISSAASTAEFDDVTVSLAINVLEPVKPTSITINKSELEMETSQTDTLSVVEILPANATNKNVLWQSSESTIADVDENGVVTAVGEGTCTIYCHADADYYVMASCEVTVKPHEVKPGEYTININNAFFGVGSGNNATEQTATSDDITFVAGCESDASSKTYYDAGHVRFYNGSYLQISVPDDYVITSIVFTADGTWNAGGISANTGTYTSNTKTWTGNAKEVDFTFTQQCRISTATVTFTEAPQVLAPSISGMSPFYPSASISMSCATDGATIHYTLNGNDPTSSDATYSAPIAITETTTIKAIAIKGSDQSDITERTFTKGTLISVAEAIELIPNNGNTANDQFVKGVVCKAGSSVSSGKMTYHISDNGTENNSLQVYLGKGLNNTDFADATDLKVGDTVVVYGQLKNYSGTYEFNTGNYIVEYAEYIASADLSWSLDAYTVYEYQSYTLPTFGNPHGLTVAFESTDESVATINELGEVTIVGGSGQTTIRASFAGGDGYQPQTAEYTLTYAEMADLYLEGQFANPKFEEGTTASEITDFDGLSVTAQYSDGSDYYIPADEITWTVDFEGGISAIHRLMNAIYVQAEWNGFSSNMLECNIFVRSHKVTWNPNPETYASIAIKANGYTDETGRWDLYKAEEVEVIVNITDNIHKLVALTAGGEDILATKAFTVDTTDIEIVATFAAKAEAGLAWSAEADTVYQYRSYTLPTLSNPNGLTVTYESTNESVATIDEYGEVTIVGGGQTTIRASFAGDDDYQAQTVEYTLTYATLKIDISLGGELTNNIFEIGTTASEITDFDGLGVVADYTDGSYYIIPDEEITWTVELQYSGSTAIEKGMTILKVTAEWNGNESNTKECIIGVKVHEVTWNPNPETFASIALLYGGSIQETGDIYMYKGDDAEVVVNITDGIHKLVALTANGEDILATKAFTVDTTDIAIIATFAEKAEADITWSAEADTAYTVGLDYDLPTLVNNNGVVVGYSSSNESVATIDNDGTITLVAAGETVIKAIFGGNEDYKPAEVSYTLTVAAPTVLALRGNLSVTEYEKGDLFNRDGIQAYAIYSDYAELEVTNLATWTINNQDEVAVNETDVYYVAAVWEGIGSGNAAYNVSVKTHKVSIAETPEHGSLVITDGNNPIAEGVEFAKGTKLYVVATPDDDYKFAAFDCTGAAEAGDDWFIVGVEDIAVSVVFVEKTSTNIEWSADQATVTIGGDDNIFPTLYNPNDVAITYSSSNEDVAAIDATSGAITLVAAGTATITATFAGDNTYKFMEISYDLTVQNKPDDPTGINPTSAESKTVKMIENNHVVIIKNGIRYSVLGQNIR